MLTLFGFFISVLVSVQSLDPILEAQSVLYGISFIASKLNNSDCYQELGELYRGVEEDHVWALKALDASGQPGHGFLYGNNLWIGSQLQCLDIGNHKKLEVNHEKIPHPSTPFDYPPFPMAFAMAYMKHNSTLQCHTQMPLEFIIQLGLCLPASCKEEETEVLLKDYFQNFTLEYQKLFHLDLNVTEVKNLNNGAWVLKLPKTIILLIIIGVILQLVLIGTIYDVKQHKRIKNLIKANNHKNKKHSDSTTDLVPSLNSVKTGTLGQVLKCFSIYSNVKALIKTKLSSDSVPSIHGLRFFGMLWVIQVHGVFYQVDFLDNTAYGFRMSEDMGAQILSNSTYCVDTYLFLSGFLVAYLYFKSKNIFEKKPVNILLKIQEFFMMFLNRFLRLTPPYVVILIFTDVMYTYYSKSSSLLTSEKADIVCPKYWWRNLLYINNLYPRSEMCMSWSWYLSLDTQLFTITSFLLILSTITFKTSAVIVFLLIIVNVITTTYKSYSIGYIPTMDEQFLQLDAIYDLPWNRIGPYLVGVVTAYILLIKMKKQMILKERTRIILWCLFPLLNLWILFTLYSRQLSVEFSAVYMGLSRILWGIGLSWLLIACCTGNARLLEKFLSYKGFILLSRLTYLAYLINPLVANMIYMGSESTFSASKAGFGVTVLGITFITFFLSFLFSLTIETPFILLTKLGFSKLKKAKKQEIQTA